MKTYDGCGTHLLMVFIAVVMFNSQPTAAQQVADKPNLDEAIATLRKVDPELLKNPDQSKWTKAEMNAAWDKMEAASTVIYKAGVCGADRVKEELKKLDDAKEKDDFFRLSAGCIDFLTKMRPFWTWSVPHLWASQVGRIAPEDLCFVMVIPSMRACGG